MNRRRRKRDKNYLPGRKNSLSDRKVTSVSRVLFWTSSVLIVLALAVTGGYVYEHYLKDSIRKMTIEAESPEIAETVPETTVEVTEEDPAEMMRRAQEELEKQALSVEPGMEFPHFRSEPTLVPTGDEILDAAERLAAGYDYDGAMEMIRAVSGYANNEAYVHAVSHYEALKAACVQWKCGNNITHVFFHSLIVNPELALSSDNAGVKAADYNKAMTTVSEFVNMMEEMYRKGYVLCDIYDIAKMEIQPDGSEHMTLKTLMLPEGKIPFIMSVDDTNYYEYMTGHGFPERLVTDEDGRVTNEYRLTDGTVIRGSFDVLPILEDFITLHPDFSYRGGRAIMAVTGYNGVLGYRTSDFWYDPDCAYYESTESNDRYRAEEIAGPNPEIDADKAKAAQVADAIKAMGWRFASHTWGHKRLGEASMETMVWDSEMWAREVEPIVGKTDLLIFPYGSDIGQTVGWKEYEYEGPNERYRTLKNYGFNYFFNVDSSVYFVQRSDGYFRQGRRNLDGERLWEAVFADEGEENRKNRLTDLFDQASLIIDPERPKPGEE